MNYCKIWSLLKILPSLILNRVWNYIHGVQIQRVEQLIHQVWIGSLGHDIPFFGTVDRPWYNSETVLRLSVEKLVKIQFSTSRLPSQENVGKCDKKNHEAHKWSLTSRLASSKSSSSSHLWIFSFVCTWGIINGFQNGSFYVISWPTKKIAQQPIRIFKWIKFKIANEMKI